MAKFKLNRKAIEETPADIWETRKRSGGGNGRFFGPGEYTDVEIVEVEEKNSCAKDETWYTLAVTLKQGEKTITHFLLIPTIKLSFGPSEKYFAFHKLKSFLRAFNVELTKENAAQVIEAVFADPKVLVGLRLNIVVAYEAYHSHYVEKDKFHLHNPDGEPQVDEGNAPLEFVSRDAAENYCKEVLKGVFSKFPNIKWVNAPSTPNTRALPTEPPKKVVKVDLD